MNSGMSKATVFLGLILLTGSTAWGADQPEALSPEEREASAKVAALIAKWEALPEKNTENVQALIKELTALGPTSIAGIAASLDAAATKDSIAIIPLITVAIRLNARAAGPGLIKIVKDSSNENFKRNAMVAIAALQIHDAVPAIFAIVSQPPLPVEKRIPTEEGTLDINLDAIVALQKLGRSYDGVSAIAREILRVIFSASEEQKLRYIQVLGALPFSDSENILLALLSDLSVDVRAAALNGLGRIGNPGNAVKVAGQLAATEPRVRSAAAVALGKMKYLPGIPQLIPLLKDQNREVSTGALSALRKLSGMQFMADEERWRLWYDEESKQSQVKFDELLNQIKSGSRELAPVFVEELAKLVLMRDKMLPHLRTLVEHDDHRVRAACCNALAQIGSTAALQLLALKLNDRSDIVSSTAWRNLKFTTGQNLPFELAQWKAYLDKRGG